MIGPYKNKGPVLANVFLQCQTVTVQASGPHGVRHVQCAIVVQRLHQTICKHMTCLFSNKILFRKWWPTVSQFASP